MKLTPWIALTWVTAVHIIVAAGTATVYTPQPYSTLSGVNIQTLNSIGPIIPAGNGARKFIISSNGNTFYTVGTDIVAIDRATGKKIRTYSTKYPLVNPLVLAVTPDNSKLLVGTCFSFFEEYCAEGALEILDQASGADLAVIPFVSDQVSGIVVAPDGANAYVANDLIYIGGDAKQAQASSNITAISLTTLQPTGSTALPGLIGNIAITPDGTSAFISEEAAIVQVTLANLAVKGTTDIPNPFGSPPPIALSSNGSTLGILSENSSEDGEAYFLDTKSGKLTGPIQAGSLPTGIAINADGTTAFVFQGYLDNDVLGELYSLNVGDLTVKSSANVGSPYWAAMAPGGRELYVLLGSGSAIGVTPEGSTVPNQLLRAQGSDSWLAISPDGQTLYSAGDGIWAISTVTGNVTEKMLEGQGAFAIAINAAGTLIYAVTYSGVGNPNVSLDLIDTVSGNLYKSIPLQVPIEASPTAIALTTDGRKLIVLGGGPAVVLDTGTNTLVAEIPPTGFAGLAVSPAGNIAYITTENAGQATGIDVVSTSTYEVMGTIAQPAYALAISPEGTRLYALTSQNGSNSIAVIDTTTLAVTNSIPGNFGSTDSGQCLAVTPDGSLLYVCGNNLPGSTGEPTNRGAVIDTQTLEVVGHFPSGDEGGSPVLIR